MRVAADDQCGVNVTKTCGDFDLRGGTNVGPFNSLKKVRCVACWCAVAQQDVWPVLQTGPQRGQPVQLFRGQLCMSELIRCAALAGALIEKLAFVVSSQVHPILSHQKLGRLQRKQWAGHAVTQVDHNVNTSPADVTHDRLDRGQIPVDVRHYGDAHTWALWLGCSCRKARPWSFEVFVGSRGIGYRHFAPGPRGGRRQQSLTRPSSISTWQHASSLSLSIARAREARLLIADTLTRCA
jgi:hypothetical protein